MIPNKKSFLFCSPVFPGFFGPFGLALFCRSFLPDLPDRGPGLGPLCYFFRPHLRLYRLAQFRAGPFFRSGGLCLRHSRRQIRLGTRHGLHPFHPDPHGLFLVCGLFFRQADGIHFVIITLIFALMGSTIGETWSDLTGGADGMTIPLSPIPSVPGTWI